MKLKDIKGMSGTKFAFVEDQKLGLEIIYLLLNHFAYVRGDMVFCAIKTGNMSIVSEDQDIMGAKSFW